MLFKSEIVTQVSGSIGGTTYSHNSAGMYRRSRTIPVNPNSTDQQAVRNNLTELAQAWGQTLTSAERTIWTNYAENNPVTGKLGDPLILSGQQMYIRCNAVILRGGIVRVDDGPQTDGLAMLTTPVSTISIAAGTISTAFTNTDAWANAVGGGLNIQTSRFLGNGINFSRGPIRINDTVVGDPTPPVSPSTRAGTAFGQSVAAATVGQKLYIQYTAFQDDGKISAMMSELADVAA